MLRPIPIIESTNFPFEKKFSIKIPPIFLLHDKMSLGHFINTFGTFNFSRHLTMEIEIITLIKKG